MEKADTHIKACWEKEAPFCGASCPFHYDIREFTARLKRGGFNAAYRTFANAVGFPAIVAALCDEPCKTVCPRQETDAAVDLRRLEQSALDYAANTKPNSYNLPPKEAKIALVGAGLSALGCALRLCNRKYRVTVFEQSGRLGGRLWQQIEAEIFLADIERQFMYEEYTLSLNTKITDVAALLDDFQAAYIACGAGGDNFGLLNGEETATQSAPYATNLPGVFLGGALTGATDMEALAQGLQAAALIEAYLKTGNMKGATPYRPTRMRLAPGVLTPLAPVPAAGGVFAKEQAVAEAARCLGCRCDACFRHCPMMNYFDKFPLRIADEVAVTIDPGTLDGNGTVATRLISTCSQCGLCAEICPQHIDVGDFLRQSHQAMRAKGAMPWAFHDFWLRDMADANSEAAAFCATPVKQPQHLFFPGCQLGASEPRYVLGAYALLRRAAPRTAIALGCCGAPALWAGDEPLRQEVAAQIINLWEEYGQPLVILACPTCREIFSRYLPKIETVFLLDHLAQLGIKPLQAGAPEDIAIFDPCAMRHQQRSRATIRDIARQAGYRPRELPYHGSAAQCCSFGGQIDIANPPYKEWLVKQRAAASDLPYLVYCSNCRDIFAAAGKPTVHVLELFEGCGRKMSQAPGIEQRLANRRLLKQEIVNKYFPPTTAAPPPNTAATLPPTTAAPPPTAAATSPPTAAATLPPTAAAPPPTAATPPPTAATPLLSLVPGLEQKLDKEHIFLADIAAVIAACEKTRRRLRLPFGHYAGHAQIGYMTYWVEYLPQEIGYTVFNAYAHRMKIAEEDTRHDR